MRPTAISTGMNCMKSRLLSKCVEFSSPQLSILFFFSSAIHVRFKQSSWRRQKKKKKERHFLYECFLLAPVCIIIHLPWWRASVNWSLIWISPEELEEKARKKLQ